MYKNFADLVAAAKQAGPVTIAVAAALDKEVLLAVKEAGELGLGKAILVGDAAKIKAMAAEVGLPADTRIIDEPDDDKAALAAVRCVHDGEAQILMKGLINTSNFLRAVLHPDVGLRSGNLLSHLSVFEVPGVDKLIFHSDGGMNVAPGLEEKKAILANALSSLRAMGIAQPKVAVLTANEQVNPKMPATTDAKALADLGAAGEFGSAIIEGPIALDVAASAEAAKHKKIESRVAGDVDLFLVPTIEAGNLLGKSLMMYAHGKMAGLILGATHPIVMVSRSDNAEAKLHALALARMAIPR